MDQPPPLGFDPDDDDELLASALDESPLDPATGVLTKGAFLHLVGGLRHVPDAGFGLVRVHFDAAIPGAAGAALRSVLRAGDVAGRWRHDEVVVLRHPLRTPSEADALAAAVDDVLTAHGATSVEVVCSTTAEESPLSLLTPARRASDTAALGAAGHRPASPAGA